MKKIKTFSAKTVNLPNEDIDTDQIIPARFLTRQTIDGTGECLLFLEKSLVWCSPRTGQVQHHPKHLIHCFVDDYRLGKRKEGDPLFRGELFSITPQNEQLCWLLESNEQKDLPHIQQKVSKWMAWLNHR